ncbi:MAG: Holliday junction branch migration protein RuvA [Fermentimonas sp.]|jgi:Holliday junction DNA helicase RuvA|nr:Holliday junction branch migration protein RuvA [Fermentimonas sp.]NLC86866.1 Holliday junction branch migration protein RuvA [Bacteroidales bacterium]HBT85259.1 Holliday junction branch migration protein RuvA [Porphyromonadaceae bacterium]MDD2931306.1 Holliday junction branch migration protein RuvA [Fermentimonas sp.]MDD3189284.1 Holliday junction branch migration protein RuvA [Fermentimonas sp.]
MIDYIKGEVAEISPASVTLECGGIGYQMNISLNTYGVLNGKSEAKLYVYESIRDDAHVLFGFMNKHERELFMLLISVSGVGPSTARVILSSLSSKELENVIASENAAALQSVKGIGAKTSQRIIVDLKDKIKFTDDSGNVVQSPKDDLSETGHAAVSALVMLGFVKNASQKVVSKIIKEDSSLPVEGIIKEALKRL